MSNIHCHWRFAGLVLLALVCGNAAAQQAVPCFGGDEPYTADTLPDVDPDTGLPCRLPTAAERAAHRGDYPAGSAGSVAGAPPVPSPRGWNGQGANTSVRTTASGYANQGGGFQGGSFTGKSGAKTSAGYGGTPVGGNPYASGRSFGTSPAAAPPPATYGYGSSAASSSGLPPPVTYGDGSSTGADAPLPTDSDDDQTPTGYEQYATPDP